MIQTAEDLKVKSYSHVLWCYSGVLLLVSVALIAPQSDRPTTISLAEKILLKIGDNNDNHDVDVDQMRRGLKKQIKDVTLWTHHHLARRENSAQNR